VDLVVDANFHVTVEHDAREVPMEEGREIHALVTGAAGGMGRATCLELLRDTRRRGQTLRLAAVGARPGDALDELVAELRTAGANVSAHVADLADPAACTRLGEEVVAACGGLDMLFSIAGMTRSGALATLDVADWDHVFNVDVRATWLLARAVRPALARSRGAIVAVASVSAHFPFPGLGAYSPAKAALVMLCRQMAQEWAADGIRVNTVSPGLIRTPLTESLYADPEMLAGREAVVPLHRIGGVDDVARALVQLAGPDFGYATGIDLKLDGGLCDRVLGAVPGLPANKLRQPPVSPE
jgi:NAD(P)-dependent dehydrogenase (short-subunit alcohol dehydrogenase family)